MGEQYIKWLYELDKSSGNIVGGKGANLAEMFNAKFPIPPAFVITTNAYNSYVEKTKIKDKINKILESIDVNNTQELNDKSKEIRDLIINSSMPEDIKEEIEESYEHLSVDKTSMQQARGDALSILRNSQEPSFVAVRSSATTEDLEDSSFAGQQESYLNIKGNIELISTVKKVLASLFTARAIYYRKKRGFSKEKFSLAVVVQKMINSDKSGVMFSKNPTKNDDSIIIEAVFGLGEGIVSGKINPDTYQLSNKLKIMNKKIGTKKIAIVRSASVETKEVKLSEEKSNDQVLTEGEIIMLGNLALKIEEHYTKPQDIEFAIEDREIFITQSRPITTTSKESNEKIEGTEILSGLGASPGIAIGRVKIIESMEDLTKVKKGDILETKMTNPDMVVTMAKADAIITDEGGVTSHAAIVSREMGIPAIVGTGNATKVLKENQLITVNGFDGKIYDGETQKEKKAEVLPIVQTKTKIKVIVDIPEAAERAALTKCDSIGLTRLEGIIATGKKHPMQYEKENNLDEYSKLLEQGISKILSYFKEIWIRSSDLRSDEFGNLKGSPELEGNPMLGNHGIRFSLKHPKILEAEFKAIKNIAEKNPKKIIGIMFPQVISVDEVKRARLHAEKMNLIKLPNVKFGVMVETPAAALVIKDIIKEGVEFISFGTNDLTQYILAIDRNNEEVQDLFEENNPAVLNAIKRVLRTCQELKVESSICGQAGSRKEMVKFLIENGITSISVNADAANQISKFVAEIENSYQKPANENFQKTEKTTPEQKTKQVIQKIEEAIVKEVVKNPKQIFNETIPPSKPIPLPPENPSYVNNKKPNVPAYISGMIKEDRYALESLFRNIPKMESTTIEEEQEESREIDEEDEIMDIF